MLRDQIKVSGGVRVDKDAANLYFIYQNSLFEGDSEFAGVISCELKKSGFCYNTQCKSTKCATRGDISTCNKTSIHI
jgi:hypothetical protein